MFRSNRLPFLARLPRHALALAAAALAAATAADAGVIVQRTSFGFGGVLAGVPLAPVGSLPYGVQLGGSRVEVRQASFSLFDPSLGTLSSVSWQIEDTALSFVLDHRAQVFGLPTNFVNDFFMNAFGEATGQIGGASLRGTAGRSFTVVVDETAGCHLHSDVGLPGFPGCGLRTDGDTGKLADSIDAQTADFIGNGVFDEQLGAQVRWSDRIDLAGRGAPPLLGHGPADVSGRFDFRGTLKLVYTYVEAPPAGVPEPGTMWLVAGLLPAAMGWRRVRGRGPGRAR